jgi:[ribosomal protein S18]-alanine N-acetyltransferase
MSDFVVRKLIKEDIPSVLALERSLATAPHWREEDYEACIGLQDGFAKRLALVIDWDGLLIGFAIAVMIRGDAELEAIGIATGNQRQGAGSQLLRAMLNELRDAGATHVFLEVRPSNYAAIALYHQFDFVEVGRRPGYYSSPLEDAIHMKCGL